MMMPLANLRVDAVEEDATRNFLGGYVRVLSAHCSKERLETFKAGMLGLDSLGWGLGWSLSRTGRCATGPGVRTCAVNNEQRQLNHDG